MTNNRVLLLPCFIAAAGLAACSTGDLPVVEAAAVPTTAAAPEVEMTVEEVVIMNDAVTGAKTNTVNEFVSEWNATVSGVPDWQLTVHNDPTSDLDDEEGTGYLMQTPDVFAELLSVEPPAPVPFASVELAGFAVCRVASEVLGPERAASVFFIQPTESAPTCDPSILMVT